MKKSRVRLIAILFVVILAACAAVLVHAGTTGIISGVVKDAESGNILSGVNIIISGTKLSTVTDGKGYYAITNVPPGEYEVSAEMVGYANDAAGNVQVTMDTTATVNFELKQEAIQEQAVVVTRPKPMIDTAVVNTLNLITAQQETLTREDPANLRTAGGVLSALPGVALDVSGSGQLHLRGGRTDQIGWYIEGIPITDPNTGMFGTNIYTTGMSRMQIYTGGFGAEYGNAISGVLNEVIKTGAANAGGHLNTESGNQYYRDGFIEFGGGEPEKFNYYVASAAQRTNLDGPYIKGQEYSDNVAKLVWPSKNDTVTLLALQGTLAGYLDGIHTTGNYNNPTPEEKDYARQRYNVGALSWSHNFSPESFLNVRPYVEYTSVMQSAMGGSFGLPFYVDSWSQRKGLQVDYTNQLNEKHLLKAGGSLLSSDNNYYMYAFFPPMGATFALYDYQNDVNTFQKSLFIQDKIKLSDKWTADAGLRYESMKYDLANLKFNDVTGVYDVAAVNDPTESDITPRLGVSFAENSRTAWKASWGKYTKFVPSNTVQKIYVDPANPIFTPEAYSPGLGATAPQNSTAYEISYEKQLTDSFAYRITPFHADYENLGDTYIDPGTGVSTYTNLGKGKSSGVELFARKKMSDKWQGWFSYTWQTTRANSPGSSNLDSINYTSWDQRHTVVLVTEYKNGKAGHSMRADIGSGRADSTSTPSKQQYAGPYCILTYNLSLDLPQNSKVGDQLYLNIFNLLNSGQAMQYSWQGPNRVKTSWVPDRFISMGVTRNF